MVRCVETGRGQKGVVFVCSIEGVGDIVIKAVKMAPSKWSINVWGKHKQLLAKLVTLRARNRSALRRRLEEFLRTYVEDVLNVTC